MNLNCKVRVGLIMVLGLVLITQYQNCAPASKVNGTADSSQVSGNPVDAIDPIHKGKLYLYKQAAEFSAADTSSMDVKGFCDWDQQGAQMSWLILNELGERVAKGVSACSNGQFELDIREEVSKLPCDKDYILHAFLGAQAKDQMTLRSHCN